MAIAPEGGFRILEFPWSADIPVDPASRNAVHVDNVHIASMFNDARRLFQGALIGRAGADGFVEEVIARIALDFVAELVWQPMVRIASRIERVGTSSYATEMLLEGEGTIFARCATTHVWMSDGSPRAISPQAKNILADLTLPTPG